VVLCGFGYGVLGVGICLMWYHLIYGEDLEIIFIGKDGYSLDGLMLR
jgi:hypothetical protein